jgi:hypothetical protein
MAQGILCDEFRFVESPCEKFTSGKFYPSGSFSEREAFARSTYQPAVAVERWRR